MARRMFDLTSSKLLILGFVALIVVGPKDLPVLLRTLGRYMGMIRRHAAEFRAQFDEAMRESELDQLRKEVEALKKDVTTTVDEAQGSVTRELAAARQDVDAALGAQEPAAAPAAASDPASTDPASSDPAGSNDPAASSGPASGNAQLGSPAGGANPAAPQATAELPALPVTAHPGIHDMKSGA